MAEVLSQAEIESAVARLVGPGQPFEVVDTNVDGVNLKVFKNAPQNLNALYRSSLEYGQRDFYVYENERYTFEAVWEQAVKVANSLIACGVRPGDRIGIACRNYPEWLFAFMGVTSIGAIAVAMNAWWSGDELVYGIKDSGLKLLFADRERVERLKPHLAALELKIITVRCNVEKHQSWEEFLSDASTTMPEISVAPDTDAMILYTSGSTSHPKGVLSTHRAIIHALLGWECGGAIAVELFPNLLPAPTQPSMLLAVPLFHVAGLNVQFLSSFRQGRKLVGMYRWDAERALSLVEEEQITQMNGVPTMVWEMIQSPNFDKYDTSSLMSMGGGGSAMVPEQSRQINDKMPNGVVGTGYGLTETNGLGTTISGDALLSRPLSCGRPAPPMVAIKIVDTAGVEVPRGTSGEIWIHGAMNFSGYWNNPEASAETLSDGWVHTGDIGYMDDENYVFITDREKDMVIRGGENIGCQEVEAVIYEHAAVLECAVFGIPDERLGETLAAVVMKKPGTQLEPEDVRTHVTRLLANFKVPQNVRITDEQLPRIASGKIFKRGLRDDTIARLSNR